MIIDTNVYSAANKGNKVAISVIKESSIVLMPIIVVGELRAGFLGGTRKEKNSKVLDQFLVDERVELVGINIETSEYYAELAVFARRSGRVLANNDIWIAAIALENKMPFATFDKDFEVFESYFGKKLRILE